MAQSRTAGNRARDYESQYPFSHSFRHDECFPRAPGVDTIAAHPDNRGEIGLREAHPALRADAQPEEHLHVAGVLVHATPALTDAVSAWISALPGACVHGAAQSKLAVTLEAADTAAILDRLRRIQEYRDVISAVPVYQHSEPVSGLDEEETYGD